MKGFEKMQMRENTAQKEEDIGAGVQPRQVAAPENAIINSKNVYIKIDGGKRAEAPAPKQGALAQFLRSGTANVIMCILIPMVTTVLLEWVARGSLGGNNQQNGFFQALLRHFPSFLVSYLLLVALYLFINQLCKRHWPAVLVVGLVGFVPAVVTYFKLTLRGEPFLPWDLNQIGDLMGVKSSVELVLPTSVYVTIGIFLLLCVGAWFVRVPTGPAKRQNIKRRLITGGVSVAVMLALMFGIFLNPVGTSLIGIHEDMWMQDRYYRTNGVITGFLTNLQMLQISQPEGYSSAAVSNVEQMVLDDQGDTAFFAGSFAAGGGQLQEQPDIIFLMGESFWDVTALPGIAYNQEILPNLHALKEEGAYGTAYTPSYGGGTCDVEFEALTGMSMEFLPAGSKPFQQYVTQDMFSLPQYLKGEGYQTTAVHGYGRRFWNRDMAYPNLGIDTFIAEDDFVNPDRKRGFISDDAMVDKIIEAMEAGEGDGPMFIHAVTMQNHTTYSRDRYPANQLVKVVSAPDTIPDGTIGQLEDCATGIRDMDAALGTLTEYLRQREKPTILVFWGDHTNPMSDGTALFEKTGYIATGETASPTLHETPLLIWSNFDTSAVQLGTLATYNIAPAMMDLYGLEKPLFFDFLMQRLQVSRGRTRGVSIQPDGSYSYEMTEQQQRYFDMHAMLQYDLLFDHAVLEDYVKKGAAA